MSRLVAVVGVLELVLEAVALRLYLVLALLRLVELFPQLAELLAHLLVLHVERALDDLAALDPRVDHEGVQRPLHAVGGESLPVGTRRELRFDDVGHRQLPEPLQNLLAATFHLFRMLILVASLLTAHLGGGGGGQRCVREVERVHHCVVSINLKRRIAGEKQNLIKTDLQNEIKCSSQVQRYLIQ